MTVDTWSCFLVLLVPLSLLLQYWIIRLAVRGGIQDVLRRKQSSVAEQELWKTIEDKRSES